MKKTGLIKQNIEKIRIKKIFDCTDAAGYVDKVLSLSIPRSEKRKIGKQFRKLTGATSQEITRLRNRHPYYKKLKNKNHTARQRQRNTFNAGIRKKWTRAELKEFLKLTETHTDIFLASKFARSIPAINAIRRRIILAHKIIDIAGGDVLELIQRDDRTLRNILKKR